MTTIYAAERLRSWLRILLAATSACLGLGLVMSFLVTGPVAQVATALVWTGLALLVLVPLLNVVSVFAEEWSAGRRAFAWAAAGVILLLITTTIYKLR
ncbi:MAG: hypothetical protein FJW21_05935 [Acidimicrobiia bacterium]|nr:hypothetical protein [Acidimicrobiia bacterium]